MSLNGRGAVVTGGGRGIGEAIALSLAEQGVRVVVCARSIDEIQRVATEIDARGGQGYCVPCDVSDEDSVAEMAEAAVSALGTVDIVVNNAGIAPSNPVKRQPLDEWQRVLDVNLTGTFLVTRAFLPEMLERTWGRVINVASIVGLRGGHYISAYAASKHGQVGFTRALAVEVAGSGVTVNAICPGYVDTPMTEASIARIVEKTGLDPEQALERILSLNPQGRLVTPEEVAHVALMLCGRDAQGVTGAAIPVDGGQDARA